MKALIINGELARPSFKEGCPCCGRVLCAEFLGYYTRNVVTNEGLLIKDFPILRYVCRAPRHKAGQHRTFSLLPAQMIPYRRPSVDFLMGIMKNFLATQDTVAKRLAMALDQFPAGSAAENLSASHLWDWCGLLRETSQKLSLWQGQAFFGLGPAMDFIAAYSGGPVRLSLDYYQAHSTWQGNSPFLFGTPSQFRAVARPP